MPFLAQIPYPEIDPVLLELGPLALRWYALAYVAGFIAAWYLVMRMNNGPKPLASRTQIDDMLSFSILGVILGGRIAYILFYNLPAYIEEPIRMFKIWEGGLSFHGGFAGMVLGAYYVCRKNQIDPLRIGDQIATVAPIGLFFGRIANFINQELWGRATDVSWAMVFPKDELQLLRHPSQLYEAALEGLFLFLLLNLLYHRTAIRERPGSCIGVFLLGYGLCRIFVEFFREPDPQLQFLIGGSTMGQLLSIPMVVLGLYFLFRRQNRPTT